MKVFESISKALITLVKGEDWMMYNEHTQLYTEIRKTVSAFVKLVLIAITGTSLVVITLFSIKIIIQADVVDFSLIESNIYYLDPLDHDELVTGYKGDYYTIDIKDAYLTKKVAFFEPGEFVSDYEAQILTVIESVYKDIYENTKVDISRIRVFLRGQADAIPFKNGNAPYNDQLDSNRILYLPTITGTQFSSLYDTYRVPRYYENEDLPMLRAAFVQELIANRLPFASKPVILEGSVSVRKARDDRNVQIIIFNPLTNSK